MSSSKHLVSVVVPLFNRADLIKETVDSVLCQTHDDLELLVVDDHSTDRSLEVVQSVAQLDSRVKAWMRHSEVKGAPACRNEGLARAGGKFIIFLDSDDLLSPNCIENRLAHFAGNPDLDFHIFPSEQFRKVPGDLGLPWFRRSDDALLGFFERPLWQTTAAIWNAESIHQLGGFREDLLAWQDWDLFVRALIADFRFQIHDVEADNFIRRSLHDRISFTAERDREKLENRKRLYRDTHQSLVDAGKLSEGACERLRELYLTLATKLKIIGKRQSANDWISEIAGMGLIPEGEVEQAIEWTDKKSRLTFSQRLSEFKLKLLPIYRRFFRS